MPKTFSELAFSPTIDDILQSQGESRITVLTGSNNSGKSAYLKKTIADRTKLYVGVNRFYSFHHLPVYTENQQELESWFQGQQQTAYQSFQNFEGSYFNPQNAITRLSNDRRKVLFDAFEELFGVSVAVQAEDPNNDFSQRYVSVGGESLSITSSGTRLFLGILAALMDERFTSIAIDEPELGLSPTLQRRLASIIVDGERRAELFPHDPRIVISTHSHLFLDRKTPANNWVVTKAANLITAKPCSSFSELNDIQFRLLGNELSHLLIPDAVMFVEGETDKIYLDKILALHLTQRRIVVEACGGDIAARLRYWSSSLGDMQISPYRSRTLVVVDSVEQAGLERLSATIGLPSQSIIKWQGNGIEYVYPPELIAATYRAPGISAADLNLERDVLRYGDFAYKKMELCRRITDALTIATLLPDELTTKLLQPLSALLATAD